MSLVLNKAIRLITLVSDGHVTLAALAREAELSKSTAHRILSTLVDANYLSLKARKYSLGYTLLELGEKKKRTLNFADMVHDIVVRYSELTLDTIHLAVLDGRDIVLVDRVAGARQLRIDSFIGQRARAATAAVGKALISQYDPDDWGGYLENLPEGYRKTRNDLTRELVAARKFNFAIDHDECDIGTCGIAATFRISEQLRAACSINGATVYFSPDRLADLVAVVRAMASEMQMALVGAGFEPLALPREKIVRLISPTIG